MKKSLIFIVIFSHILLAKNERTFLPGQLYTSSLTSMHLSHHERASRSEKRVVAAGTTVSFGRFPWPFSEKAVPLRPIRARARAQKEIPRPNLIIYSGLQQKTIWQITTKIPLRDVRRLRRSKRGPTQATTASGWGCCGCSVSD